MPILPVAIENTILNSPYREPTPHWQLDNNDPITRDIVTAWRSSCYFLPTAPTKKKGTPGLFGDDRQEQTERRKRRM